MATDNKTEDGSDLTVQEHCIDLPGESVQCWIGGGTDKLKVILRKHRDVIFDIHLGNGKTYALETTESDFYSARDKKLVYAAQRGKVTFNDGEHMHVWVSRGFRGALVLKCDGHVLSEVKPNEWDTHRYNDDPKEKPAPIIVAIGHHSNVDKTVTLAKSAIHVPPNNEDQSLHVHELSKKGAPPAILAFFEDGGDSLHWDKKDIVTRNWIFAQLGGAEAYMFDNRLWMKELINCELKLLKVIHRTGPKIYVVFNGNNRLRELMSATKYGLQHPKILKITGGAGGVKQTWEATKGAAKDSIKLFAKEEGKMVVKGAGLAVVLTIGMDMAEWYKDYSEIGPDGKRKKDLCDLAAKVGIDLLKGGIVAAMTTATIATCFSVVAGVVAGAVAAPVILVVLGTIAVSVVLAYGVDRIDKAIAETAGEQDTATWLAKKMHHIPQYLIETTKDTRYTHYAITRESPI
jgi:hypothetical protein